MRVHMKLLRLFLIIEKKIAFCTTKYMYGRIWRRTFGFKYSLHHPSSPDTPTNILIACQEGSLLYEFEKKRKGAVTNYTQTEKKGEKSNGLT